MGPSNCTIASSMRDLREPSVGVSCWAFVLAASSPVCGQLLGAPPLPALGGLGHAPRAFCFVLCFVCLFGPPAAVFVLACRVFLFCVCWLFALLVFVCVFGVCLCLFFCCVGSPLCAVPCVFLLFCAFVVLLFLFVFGVCCFLCFCCCFFCFLGCGVLRPLSPLLPPTRQGLKLKLFDLN